MSNNLNPDKALIFRIVHRHNMPWILDHGLHCKNSSVQAPNYRTIGNPDIIQKREHRPVPVEPSGTLSDYVPFYFTPYSPMMYNIITGYGGITKCPNTQIVICVSSLHRLADLGRPFVFTDRHAYLANARYFNNLSDLGILDWAIWQARDFKRDSEDPGKVERYQAEALVHQALPVEALLGVVCYTINIKRNLDHMVAERGLNLDVREIPGWYF
jgi:hypothetical protein